MGFFSKNKNNKLFDLLEADAKKEAAETRYWLELLHSGEYISDKECKSMVADCNEILSILVSIIKTASENS